MEDAFKKLSILAKDLNLNLTRVADTSNKTSRPSQLQQNANEIWKTLSPVICGTAYDGKKSDQGKVDSDSIVPDLFVGHGESRFALEMMLYMLTHDPMVLYAPNGTDADKVVRKVSPLFNIVEQLKPSIIRTTLWFKQPLFSDSPLLTLYRAKKIYKKKEEFLENSLQQDIV